MFYVCVSAKTPIKTGDWAHILYSAIILPYSQILIVIIWRLKATTYKATIYIIFMMNTMTSLLNFAISVI